MKKEIKKGCLFTLALVFILLGAGLALSAAAFYFKYPHELWDRLLPIPHGEMKVVVIKPGLNARQCAQAFYDQEALTDSPAVLARWMTKFGIDRKFRPGQYRVFTADSWNMARQLLTVQPITSSLTIIPGMDVFSLRTVFDEADNPISPEGEGPEEEDSEDENSERGDSEGGDLLRACLFDDQNYPLPMREYLPESEEARIAFLLPETYFTVEESPKELVRVASHAWWDRYGDRLLSGDVTSADIREKATVASMVQREALMDEERPVIAGVIENRLEKDMLLQIDATVVYAWKLRGKNLTRVLYSDLEVDSPYNTYITPGLPPAPICIPSAESWEAALAPEENPYYYYVARKDGYHYFAETYDGHRRNIRKARTE